MTIPELALFLIIVGVGSYVQAVTGFAMGMIIVAGTAVFSLMSLPTVTAVISLVTFVNALLSLRGHYREVHGKLFVVVVIGQIPAIALGIQLLDYLDAQAELALSFLLGLFIVGGSLSMALRPEPRPRVSGVPAMFAAGASSGVLGGMFAASAPILGWFTYRQPLPVAAIRATLLSCFAMSTFTRNVLVGAQGGVTLDVLTLAALGLPLVIVGSWLGREFPIVRGEYSMRRFAFSLTLVLGLWILGDAGYETFRSIQSTSQ